MQHPYPALVVARARQADLLGASAQIRHARASRAAASGHGPATVEAGPRRALGALRRAVTGVWSLVTAEYAEPGFTPRLMSYPYPR